MSTLAILGTGRVAMALADGFAAAGHTVVIGTRDPARASTAHAGKAFEFAGPEEAARRAEVVVNATPGEGSLERLTGLREALRGTILVDVSNATRHGGDGMPGELLHPGGSLAELLQRALPATRVVKTLNTMFFTVMTDPRALATPPTAFLSGDDPSAKTVVRALLADLGWPAEWIEDLGEVHTARATEAVMLLVPAILRSRGLKPFALAIAS